MNADDYNSSELEAGRVKPDHISAAVRVAQRALGLAVDGKLGPSTRAKLLAAPEAAPPAAVAVAPPIDRLQAAGERALARALAEWRLGIFDPKRADKSAEGQRCRAAIERYMHDGAGWLGAYAGDGAVEWCGIFTAYAWAEDLDADLRHDFLPSTYRLENWRTGRPPLGDGAGARDTRPVSLELGPRSTAADVASFGGTGPRAGDILVVGDGTPGYGEHIAVVYSFDPDVGFHTVEGNGGGSFPNGTRGQGVVRAVRPLGAKPGISFIARRIYRPTLTDLT